MGVEGRLLREAKQWWGRRGTVGGMEKTRLGGIGGMVVMGGCGMKSDGGGKAKGVRGRHSGDAEWREETAEKMTRGEDRRESRRCRKEKGRRVLLQGGIQGEERRKVAVVVGRNGEKVRERY